MLTENHIAYFEICNYANKQYFSHTFR